mgnify:FL=1
MHRKLILSALFLSHAAFAGPALWTTAGPDGGGLAYLATSAASPNTVYVASSFAIFRSNDSGASFSRRAGAQNLGIILDVVVSPTDANLVYLLTDTGVMRSTDGAASFALAVTGLPLLNFIARDLAMQPGTPGTLIVTSSSDGAFRSTDGGTSWSAVGAATLPTRLSQVAFDPTNPSRVLISPCAPDNGSSYTGAPLYRSTDGGVSFSAVTVTGAPPELATCTAALAFSSTTPGLVLATEGNGPQQPFNMVLRSSDGGLTFTRSSSGPAATLLLANFSFVPGSPAVVLAANARGSLQRSVDDGVTFTPAPTPTFPGPSPALESQAVTAKPGDPSVRYFISRGAGFFRSTDAGATWTESNVGIGAVNVRTIAVNPANPALVYAGHAESEGPAITWPFFRSSDGGSSWAAAGSGFALDWIRGLLVDANTATTPASTVLYAVGRDIAPTAVPAGQQRASGVAKSTNGGATWTNLNSFAGLGAPNPPVAQLGTVRTIVPDRSVVTSGAWTKLYLTASGVGTCASVGGPVSITVPRLWRTLDAGATWNTISTAGGTSVGSDGLPTGECVAGTGAQPPAFADFPIPVPLVVDHAEPNTLYVGTYLRGYNSQSSYTPNAPNGVFKSTDGGVNWTLASTGLPLQPGSTTSHYAVLALAMDPTNRNVLYAAVNPFLDNSGFVGNVYKTTNGGTSWAPAGSGLAGQDIRALLIDPDNSLRVFAASGGSALNPGGVFVSEDGGATWNSISAGLPVTSATALAIDNTDPAGPVIHAGTRTGVYSFTRVVDGDGDGSPTAPENAAPNGGDGNGDGQPDSNQSNVASLPGTSTRSQHAGPYGMPTPLQNASLPFTVSLTPLSGNCSRLYDVIAVPSDTFAADPSMQKPDGAFRFEVANCTRVRVSLRVHGGGFNPLSVVRAFGARVQGDPLSIDWNTLAADVAGDTISFVLSDNQPGDARQDSGRILFQGGPAFELPLFGNGFE